MVSKKMTMYPALGAKSDYPQVQLRTKMTIDVIRDDLMMRMKRYGVKYKTQDGSEKFERMNFSQHVLTLVMLTDLNHGRLKNYGHNGCRRESLGHFHEKSVSCMSHDHKSYCDHMMGCPNCVRIHKEKSQW